jgi:hypothetical protein
MSWCMHSNKQEHASRVVTSGVIKKPNLGICMINKQKETESLNLACLLMLRLPPPPPNQMNPRTN